MIQILVFGALEIALFQPAITDLCNEATVQRTLTVVMAGCLQSNVFKFKRSTRQKIFLAISQVYRAAAVSLPSVPLILISPSSSSVRFERPQSAETRGCRAHAGHSALPGGETAVA